MATGTGKTRTAIALNDAIKDEHLVPPRGINVPFKFLRSGIKYSELPPAEQAVPYNTTGFSPYQYRKKVEAYIRANQNHVAIAKLRRNLPLTATDLTALEEMLFTSEGLETREKFFNVYANTAQNLQSFIRSLVGLDRAAAKEAFAKYLQDQQFSANQIRFVEQIIDLLTQQGVMNPSLLYEPPFTDFHQDGLDGVFDDRDADSIVAIIRSFNQTVEVNFNIA